MPNMKATTNKNVKNMVDERDQDYRFLCHGCHAMVEGLYVNMKEHGFV